MRRALIFLAAIVLTACGGSDGPRVALPLEAPERAHPLLKDFIDICSLAIDDPVAASALAKERGWIFATGSGGISVFESVETDGVLQINELDFPHLEYVGCMINLAGDIPANLELERIGDIDGVLGELLNLRDPTSPIDEAIGNGRWSFINEADQVVTITTTEMPETFVSLGIYTSHRTRPDKN